MNITKPSAQPSARPAIAPTLLAMALAATSIGALLSDMYGVLSMHTFFWYITVPSMVVLAVLGSVRIPALLPVQERIRVGAVAGIAGLIGYDVVRIPLVVIGQRVMAPIDSYGLLISGNSMATPWSNTIGWLFHLSNGITFGVIYCLVAARAHWIFGVLWGVTLETAVVFSPFLERYGLAGKYGSIALAFAAHVAYGLPVGKLCQRFDRTRDELASVFKRPAVIVIGIAFAGLVLWHHPWTTSSARREASRVAAASGQASVVVTHDRFIPEWVRIEPGECVHVANRTTTSFTTKLGPVPAAAETDLCPKNKSGSVARVKLNGEAYSGGFVMVQKR
jgi:hypothetical protein